MKYKILFWFLALITTITAFIYNKANPIFVSDKFSFWFDKGIGVINILLITFIITKFIDLFFFRNFTKLVKYDSLAKKIMPLIQNILTIVIWIVWILFAINSLGLNINSLLTGAWLTWVLVALASKEIVTNLTGSLSLIFSKSFKIGDNIKIKWIEWVVDEINLNYTRLVDKKGNFVYIPNKNIITESIENMSTGKFKKQEINIPLPISISSNDLNKFLQSLEKYWNEVIKSSLVESFKVVFDSFTLDSQIIIFQFQIDFKSDSGLIKKEISLKIKELIGKIKIEY